MLDVYFIRHGETYCNQEGRHTGWLEYPLTDNGRLQAERSGHYFGKMQFDRYYCSDLCRTRETFKYVFGEDKECVYTPVLRELSSGDLAGHKYEECYEMHGEKYTIARQGWNYRCFGGEDMQDLYDRAQAFMDEMAALPKDVRRVAAVSHGGMIRACASLIVGGTMPDFPMTVSNCACFVLRLNDAGKWSVRHWNWIAPENME